VLLFALKLLLERKIIFLQLLKLALLRKFLSLHICVNADAKDEKQCFQFMFGSFRLNYSGCRTQV
jgi:hypothetical protein